MAEEKKDIKDEAKKESKFKDGYTDENAEVWFHLGFGPVNEDEHDMNAHDRFITFRSRMYGKAALEAQKKKEGYKEDPNAENKHYKLVISCLAQSLPNTSKNFMMIASGDQASASDPKKMLKFEELHFHRVIDKFVAQSGDVNADNGSGGECWPGTAGAADGMFPDENIKDYGPKGRGDVYMANKGYPNSNHSQFFITFDECKFLHPGKKGVSYQRFGKVKDEESLKVLQKMEDLGTGMGQPKEEIFIFGSGIVDPNDPDAEKEHIEHTELGYAKRMEEKQKEIDELRKAMDLEPRYAGQVASQND